MTMRDPQQLRSYVARITRSTAEPRSWRTTSPPRPGRAAPAPMP